jgi:hypothetical protein
VGIKLDLHLFIVPPLNKKTAFQVTPRGEFERVPGLLLENWVAGH